MRDREQFDARDPARFVGWVLARHHPRVLRIPEFAEEAMSDGLVGFTLALRDYDPDRGLAFSTYALIRVRGAIRDGFRSRSGIRTSRGRMSPRVQARAAAEHVSIDAPDRYGRTLAERVPAELDPVLAEREAADDRDALVAAIRRVYGPRDARAAELLADGRTLAQAAAELGVTEARVSQLRKRWSSNPAIRRVLTAT